MDHLFPNLETHALRRSQSLSKHDFHLFTILTRVSGAVSFPSPLKGLLLVWTFAAFGQEIGYRGYLINRAADAGGRSKAVYWIAVVLVSVLFGYGHYYKGPAGVVDSGMAGLVLGAAYVLSGRNLWVCVLAHGFIDTIGLIAVFFGWSS